MNGRPDAPRGAPRLPPQLIELVKDLAVSSVVVAVALVGLAFIEVPVLGSVWQRISARPFTKEAVAESQVIGDGLIAALERHRAAEGTYPDDLDDLTPRYVDDIASPTAGCRGWGYRLVDEGFELRFHAPGEYPVAFYESARGRWLVND
jgi:hypothetical protein